MGMAAKYFGSDRDEDSDDAVGDIMNFLHNQKEDDALCLDQDQDADVILESPREPQTKTNKKKKPTLVIEDIEEEEEIIQNAEVEAKSTSPMVEHDGNADAKEQKMKTKITPEQTPQPRD